VRLLPLVVLIALCGCGRIGFEPAGGDPLPGADAALPEPGPAPDGGVIPDALGCTGSRPPLLASGLASYWAFNDGAPAATDSSATAAHGSFEGAPTYMAGVIGTGLVFDGTQAVVVPGQLLSGQALDGDFTVDAWVQPDDCSQGGAILARGTGESPGFVLGCTVEGLSFEMLNPNGNSQVLIGSGLGAWHHVAAVRRGDKAEIYFDGLLVGVPAVPPATALSDTNVYIGRDAAGAHFTGMVDEVRLWSRALSSAEIQALHSYYRPGVLAHWSFDRDVAGEAGLPYDGANPDQVPLVAGRVGQALSFAGSGRRVTFDMPDVFSRTYSAEVWFRTTSTGGLQSILNREEPPRAPVHLWVDDTLLNANVRGDGFLEVGTAVEGTFTDGCWHHVVLVREGLDLLPGSVTVYVDGALGSSSVGVFGLTAVAAAPFEIGYRLPDDPRAFGGEIAEVRIFERALTAEEARALYDIAR
jgi:hypothetical protein